MEHQFYTLLKMGWGGLENQYAIENVGKLILRKLNFLEYK
jgi:hypothetical protein